MGLLGIFWLQHHKEEGQNIINLQSEYLVVGTF